MTGPVIIGGVGGSGTRVVVNVLQAFSFNFGKDLNKANDNLTFTLLFRRPGWLEENISNENLISLGIRILEKSMITRSCYSINELSYLIKATIWMMKNGLFKNQNKKAKWAFNRFQKAIINTQKLPPDIIGWGWKEPNSHLLLENLNGYFPEMKYIHTIRNGLDMAFSANQNQLYNWGKLYGVKMPEKEADIPAASFSYWVKANKKVLELQKQVGKDKIYLLNFDRLCSNPSEEIKKLIEYLGINVSNEKFQQAVGIPVIPDSSGRYKKYDISNFNQNDIDFYNSLGFLT